MHAIKRLLVKYDSHTTLAGHIFDIRASTRCTSGHVVERRT